MFHIFNLAFSLFIFSFNTNPPHPLCWLDLQHSCRIELKDLSISQQSRIRNGFGLQSTNLDHSKTGQWSEKFLSIGCWMLPGHLMSQSGDTRNRSSLLFVVPLGLNHVNFLPTYGASSTSISSIQSLNIFILLSSVNLWQTPTLSSGYLMLLKSPVIHHRPP